jgi:glycosyltransferase involved in cell wall biosynthesis
MKKICVIAYTLYSADHRVQREAETLVRRGDQVDLISLAESGRPATETAEGVHVFRVGFTRYRGSSSVNYIASYFRFLFSAAFKVTRLHLKNKYDVVYVHTMPDFMVLAGLIPKLLGAKLVLDIHDMMPELYVSKFGVTHKHPLIRFLAFQEQFSARIADKVVCVHKPHQDVLTGRGTPASKMTILPNLTDPLIFRTDPNIKPDTGGFRIVYHGTIAHRLGPDLAVDAFAKIAASCPGARLEIYGSGDSADEVEEAIERSGVADRIVFPGKIFSIRSVAQMISGAAIGIVPNRRDPSTEYMLPVKMLEYAHFGIPVIAPRLLAIQHYFTDENVLYYEPGNVDELAEAIHRLYSDPALRTRLSEGIVRFAEGFNWETFKLDLYKVIDDWPDRKTAAV